MGNYQIIRGTFHVKGFSPDGDSIRFKADVPARWDALDWKSQAKKKAKTKQLRIEAIDALETHYQGFHQPQAFAIAALETLLGLLGIGHLRYSLAVTRIVAADDGKPGTIAVSGLDGFHRPICFVFPEDVDLEDGAALSAGELPLDRSVNLIMAEKGLVYPTFYTTMEPSVLPSFQSAVGRAKASGRGLWAVDQSGGFSLDRPLTIQEDVVILPKLFRRLCGFLDRRSDLEQLPAYLKDQKDKVRRLSDGQEFRFSKLIQVEGREVGLTVAPEDLAFVP